MRIGALVCAAVVAVAATGKAQTRSFPRPELRPLVGAFVPTADQADIFKSAFLAGGEAAMEVNKFTTLLGSFSWAPAKLKLGGYDDKANIYSFDVGLEFAQTTKLAAGWDFKPFLGAGVGGRTYDYADKALPGNTGMLGYGALGTEFQFGVTALRLEARDVVTGYKAPLGTRKSSTRNDVALFAGFAYHFW
jgi:hypothetical protein